MLEVAMDHVRREAIDARGHRRMRGKDVPGGGHLARLVEGEPVLVAQEADPLQAQERGVALVHVADDRRQAKSAERLHPPDPKQDLLPDAHIRPAPLDTVGDILILARVLRQVRV